ncbi:hypothetical protein ATJ88_3238 [Isoptericola jiangsuensis]|uniref:Uncharacterized protein n=1 Tax=Isoptericola jiangsuensis TaxID=548579 RepID=A0A2A9F0J3_9MICO|nr:hypothetical protein [Isoptericola jiangsuensis]PFG44513.1 hypothetical protein ATJ88_3238 [Isoptericola jiangsuensis]
MADEFLVLGLGDEHMKVGKSYLLLGVAPTAAKARELAEELPAATASRVVIAQRHALVRRVPAVRLEDLDDSLVDTATSARATSRKEASS